MGRGLVTAVEFGIFDHLDRGAASLRQLFADRLTILEAYDRLGFFCYHLAEHHGRPIGMAPAPTAFLAAAAQRTTRLRLGTLVYLLPFYHPLRLLEEICMLDQLSGGRLEVGVGRGIQPIEARFYDLQPAELQARYEETLAILHEGLRTETLSFVGHYHRFDRVPLEVQPLQRPFPPFWYGVHGPESAARAAARGFHVVTNEGTSAAREVAQAARETGHERVGIVRFIHVAEREDEALRVGQRAYERWIDSFYRTQRAFGQRTTYEKSPSLAAAIDEGMAFAGSPATVRDALGVHLAETGVDYVLGQFAFGDLTLGETLRSIELFAREVMPPLREGAWIPSPTK